MYPIHQQITEQQMPKLQPLPIPVMRKRPLSKLIVWARSKRHWKLVEDWYYILPDGRKIMIPQGFEFDGVSIPRIFWSILSPVGLLMIPSLIHDYAYRYNMLWEVERQDDGRETFRTYQQGAGRRFWDTLFRQVAHQVNGFFFVNHLAWAGLVCGGWWAWKQHRQMGDPPPYPVSILQKQMVKDAI